MGTLTLIRVRILNLMGHINRVDDAREAKKIFNS